MTRQEFIQMATDQRLARADFLVEATDGEQFALWERWAEESQNASRRMLRWEQLSGNSFRVGELDRRPVNVTIVWNLLNGKLVGFWEAHSQVVDHVQIDAWFHRNYKTTWQGRPARCNAMNFHHAVEVLGAAPKGELPVVNLDWEQVAADYLKEHWNPGQDDGDVLYYTDLPDAPWFVRVPATVLPCYTLRHTLRHKRGYDMARFSYQQMLLLRAFLPAGSRFMESMVSRGDCQLVNYP